MNAPRKYTAQKPKEDNERSSNSLFGLLSCCHLEKGGKIYSTGCRDDNRPVEECSSAFKYSAVRYDNGISLC